MQSELHSPIPWQILLCPQELSSLVAHLCPSWPPTTLRPDVLQLPAWADPSPCAGPGVGSRVCSRPGLRCQKAWGGAAVDEPLLSWGLTCGTCGRSVLRLPPSHPPLLLSPSSPLPPSFFLSPASLPPSSFFHLSLLPLSSSLPFSLPPFLPPSLHLPCTCQVRGTQWY